MKKIDLSIVIISHNTQKFTYKCLNSVFQSLKNSPIHYEVIVVDNASVDGTVAALRGLKFRSFDLKVVESKRNLGFALVEFEGQKSPSTVVIGEKDDSPLLGALSLEGMGLMVDPFSRKLRPMKLMLG